MATNDPPYPVEILYKASASDSEQIKDIISATGDTSGVHSESKYSCMVDVLSCNDSGDVVKTESLFMVDLEARNVYLGGILLPVIRYAVLDTHGGSVVVILSLRECQLQEVSISFIYMAPQNNLQAVNLVNAVRCVRYKTIRSVPGNEYFDNDIAEALTYNKPLMMKQLQCTVYSVLKQPTCYFVIADKEGFSFFKHQFADKACFNLFFWEEGGPHVLDKITKSSPEGIEVIRLECMGQIAVDIMTNQDGIQDFMQVPNQVTAITKTAFLSDTRLLQYLISRKQSRFAPRNVTVPTLPRHDSALTESANLKVLPRRDRTFSESANLKDELDTAEDECKRVLGEEMNNIHLLWICGQSEMEAILMDGLVPKTALISGGLDENNISHFKKCIEDAEEQLRQEDYHMALSRIQGMKEVFKASDDWAIKEIVGNNDIELLKKIHYRSYCFK